MVDGIDLPFSGVALYLVTAVELSQSFGMVPMAMRNKEIPQHDMPFLNKVLNLCAKTSRIDKYPDPCPGIGHQITVNRVASYRKASQYQIIHHDTITSVRCMCDMNFKKCPV